MTQYCLIAEREKFVDIVNTLSEMNIKMAPVRSMSVINLFVEQEQLEEIRKLPGAEAIVEPDSPTMKEITMGEL